MKTFSTETQVRVRYADTDQMKFVYYARFFEYFEQGRSDLLRGLGMPYPEIEKLGYHLPVVEAHANYFSSARYDDLLTVRTILAEPPQVRIRITYEVELEGKKLAEGHTIHSFVSAATGRPVRPPNAFLDAIAKRF